MATSGKVQTTKHSTAQREGGTQLSTLSLADDRTTVAIQEALHCSKQA